MKKRWISLLLCAAMVFGMIPAVAPTAEAVEVAALDISSGVTFTSSADQLAMEEQFDAVPLSFEATVMLPEGYTDRAGVIAGNWRNGANSGEFDSTREYVAFEIHENGHPRLYWQESHGKSTAASHKLDLIFDEVNVATGEYVHVAVTYDPDTDTASCYVNGELKQTLTNGNITPTVPFGPLKVGGDYRDEAKQSGSNAQYFKGTIANLSVWFSVLAEADVKAHYDALCADGSAVPSTGDALLGSWDLTAPDANGDYADKSANGNDVYVFSDWVDGDFAQGDYTMLVMPDPQILMKWQTESWYKYTQWIADNVDDLNVQAVISVGDMINDNNTEQWTKSTTGVKTFEETGVPWVPMRGNHDPSAEFNTYYPYSNYGQKPWFGGSYEEGKMDNCYWFVTVGDREYMILYLGWAPSWDVLDWAEDVVKTFPEKNVIVSTHAYMNWDNTLLEAGDGGCVGGYSGFTGYPEGVDIWEKLGKYENVVLALGGHIGSSDLACWEDENGGGKTVTSMLVDSQHLDYVAAGLICVLTFHEDSDVVDVNWYSPVNGKFFRERNQFSISVPHVEGDGSAVDTAKLKIEILNAETLAQINYTADSWAVFDSALTAARAVLDDASVTQDQVNAAVTALKNARAALVERSGLSFSASAKNYAQFSACAVIPETVEIWVKIPKGYSTRNMIAGGYGYNSATASTEIFWALEMQANGTLRWWEEAANKEMKNAKFDGTNSDNKILLNTGEWMLISIVRDQENKEVRAYINGELAGTTKNICISSSTGTNVFNYTTGKTTTDPTRLGRDWRETAGQTALTFEGSIGEIRTWSDDRTAAEIKAGFEGGIDLSDANLYGCWQLTEIPYNSAHPYTFYNLATGAAALTDLSISTVGFTSARDTTALEAAIAEAKALTESDYTAESWAALETALTAAEAAVADTANTQAEIVAALNALETAMAGLMAEIDGLTFSATDKNYAEFSQAMTIPETVEVWFQIPEGYGSRALLAGGYGIKGKATSETFWGIDTYANGKVYWWEETAGKELWVEIPGVTGNTGEWQLLSIVRDQDNDQIRAYLNGELVSTITNLAPKGSSSGNVMDSTTGKTTTIPIRLGRDWREDQGKAALTYEGRIGEIRVYSDDRTAAEIKAGYENDLLADSKQDDSYLADANLTGCWRLRDLEDGELHTFTFENLSTGTGAVSALTIKSAGFTNPVVNSDKTALKADIDAAKALVETDYTADSWTALETALAAAEAVYGNTAATQTIVDEAEVALEAAMAALKVERTGLEFEAASNEYAEFTDLTVIPETVSVWVKIPANSTKREMIIGSYGHGNTSQLMCWGLEVNASGYLRWWEEGPGDVEMASAAFDGTNSDKAIKMNTGEWMYVTIVRDQENKEIRAYINGELAGTTTKIYSTKNVNVFDATTGKTTTVAPRIGRDYREEMGSAPVTLNGEVGEIHIWTDDRTAAEIKADYENDCKGASVRDMSYLTDANLYGAWQLRELTESETHAYTFKNLATGTGAASALGIRTDGFKNPAGTVYVDGLTFSAAEKHYAQFTDCTVIPETVDIWVKIPKGYSKREMIVGGYGMTGKGQTEIFWALEMNASGTLRWWEEASYKEMNLATFSNIYINTGEWILVTIVRDQENKQVKAYINGELAGTTDKIQAKVGGQNVFDYTTGKMTTDPPRLGRDWRETLGDAVLTFEGRIGELRMWTDDRTDAEIKAGYENDILPDAQQTDTYLNDANLYGAWKLRDLTATEGHPHLFTNQATGAAAAKDLAIRTVGFISAEDDVAPDYSAQYTDATGIKFDNSTNQMRAEEEFDSPIRTISALVNLSSGSAGGVILGNDMYIGGYSSTRAWINLEVNSSGQPFLQLRRGNQSTPNTYTADTVDLRGKGWVLVTVVFDEDCDLIRWYINGKRVESQLGATANLYAPFQPMKIGGDYSFVLNSSTNVSQYNTTYFKGTIAYVSAWSSIRTGTEILAEAQALQADYTNVPASGDGLLASWSFAGTGDVLTTTYADKSANGNDVIPYAELINDYDPAYLEANNIETELPTDGDYSILIMPDIQNITRDHMGGYSAYLDDYMQWIVDNQEKYNIIAYLNMGDLTQDDSKKNNAGEWENVANAFPILEEAGIPGVPMRGNHDGSGFYSDFIDYDYYTSQPWFGGVFEEGYLDNSYWFIEAGERTYLVFSLGWSTASDAIATGNSNGRTEREVGDNDELMAWVNGVIEKYPNANVIFTSHNGMSWTGNYSATGQKLYDKVISKHNNIVLASYGHIDDYVVIQRTDTRPDGVKFPSLLVDGQGIDQYEGCKGFVCLLTFKNNSDEVQLNWYSTRDGSLYRVDGQYSITVPHVDGVDLTNLEADITAAEALEESEYTAESWAVLEEALADADTVIENKLSVSQDEVDAAEKTLEEAIAGLKEKPKADKTALQEAVDAAEALAEDDYTSDTWAALEEALTAAQAVLDDPDATQDEVDAAEKTLEDAMTALVERGDKSSLQALVDEVNALDETGYTPSTWVELEAALAAAEEILADEDALQEELDPAELALKAAKEALVERADTTELAAAIAAAEALDSAVYTSITWKDVEAALTNAISYLTNYEATQGDVDAATAALVEAMANLKEKVTLDSDSSGGASGGGAFVGGDAETTCPSDKFVDLDTTKWYHAAADYVILNGIMNGTGNGNGTTFSPYMNLTRGMMMTMLARLDGVDTSGGSVWYERGMTWAMAQGVSDGTNPEGNITREQMVTMLYRYVGGTPVSINHVASYTDGDKVSSWAVEAMNWAIANGVITGKGNGILDPQGAATRIEVAQVLMNYFKK